VFGKASVVGVRTACGAVPVPVRAAACGEFPALSVTVIAAVKLPAEAGVNVAEMLQVAPTASVAPHPFVIAKSAVFAPVSVTLVMFSVADPGFESTVVSDADVLPTAVLGNDSVVGVSTACGVGAAVPVPVSVALCGEFEALSTTFTVALKLVADAGVNVTEILQVPPAASVAPHPFVSPKSAGFVPPSETLVMFNVAVPGFESTITCVLLVVLTVWFPKGTVVGVSTACGDATTSPFPCKLMI